MPRYIDAYELQKRLLNCEFETNCVSEENKKEILMILRIFIPQIIANEPTADVEPVRHGKWEIKLGFLGEKYSECSYCRYDISDNDVPKHILKYDYKYCPNCGARLKKEVEE